MSWEYKTLDELGNISRGKSKHRPRNDPKLFGGKYPFIQTADVKSANFYLTKYSETYNEQGLSQSKLWKSGTLCITIAANIADTAILGIDACFPDSIMGFIPFEGVANVKFVKYAFDILQKNCQKISQGAAQDNLSWEKLSTIKFPAPPINVQNRIANILSAYDDLIENNQKQIKLLEEAAQRLYKEWFVDLHFPGYENSLIIDGIPQGWKKEKIDEQFSIKYGKTLPTSMITERGKFPVYGANGTIGFFSEKNCDDYVVLITSRGNGSGEVLRTHDKESFVTNNSFIVISKQGHNLPFIHQVMMNTDFKSVCTGSAQPQLTNNSISTIQLTMPTIALIQLYGKYAKPFYDKTEKLNRQIKQLQEARDRLLPKLMNGELEV